MHKFWLRRNIGLFWSISYLVVLIFPILFNSVGYVLIERTLTQKINDSKDILLQRNAMEIDSEVDKIVNACINVSSSEKILDMSNYTYPLKPEQRYMSMQILNDWYHLFVSDLKVDGIVMYFPKGDFVIYNNIEVNATGVLPAHKFFTSIINDGDEEHYQHWHELLNNKRMSGFIGNVFGNNMQMGYKYSPTAKSHEAFVVMMYFNGKTILPKMDYKNYSMFILNSENTILLANNPDLQKRQMDYDAQGILNDKNYVFSFTNSKSVSLCYALAINKTVFFKEVARVRYIMLFGNLLCIFVGILMVLYLVKVNKEPISEIMEQFYKYDYNPKIEGNEYQQIKSGLDMVINKNITYENEIEKQNNVLLHDMLIKYIENGEIRRGEELKLMKLLNNDFVNSCYMILMFFVDDVEQMFFENGDVGKNLEYAKIVVTNIVCEMIDEKFKSGMINIDNMQVCIVNLPDSNDETKYQVLEIVQDAGDFIMMHFNFKMIAGVSKIHDGFENLPLCYDEAQDALRYLFLNDNELILDFANISKRNATISYYYPFDIEHSLMERIGAGDFEKSKEMLVEIFRINFEKIQISLGLTRCLMFDISGTLIKLIEEKQYLISDIFKNESDVFGNLAVCETIKDMQDEIMRITHEITQYIGSDANAINSDLINRVIQFIHENYSDDRLNVTFVADHMNVSSDYLSYEFKRNKKIGLLEYINRLRIEKAKSLIKSGDDTIENISKATGFSNYRTFFRAFVKYQNMSPKEYKEL